MEEIKLPIACPPWTALGKRLESTCRKALFEYSMLDDVKEVAVALSGGKDSLSLLFLLNAISGKGFPTLKIHAIHIDGEVSCGAGIEQNFLKGICRELGVNFINKTQIQNKEDLHCYPCSRNRRKLIFDAAKEIGVNTIAFGHHRDDNIQTLLLNLLHKAEFAGNLPKIVMKDFNVTIIRPLIYIKENDLINFAKAYGFARITCQCPVGQNSKRKQVQKLIEKLEDVFPNTRTNLAQAVLAFGSKKAQNP